jgi:hypothetical protein
MAQSYYALGHTWNVGTAAATRAMDIASGGAVLINTTTDNGVDKLQVNGSMNVSTLATAQNLSVTNNATISNKLAIRTTTQTANLTVLGGYSIGGSIPTDWNFMSAGRAGVVSSNKGFYFDIIGGSYAEFSTFDWGTSQPYNMVFQGNGGRLLVATTTDNTVDRLQVNGSISGIGMKQAYVTKTGAYTATNDDYVIDCTSGTFTVTLPASSGRTGRILIIKNSGAGTITVDGNASETIDGAATYAISVQYGTIQIMSDGTNWKIISKF